METYNFDDKYTTKRVAQLQDMDKQDLINLMAKYELELLDYADRLLSEEPISMDAGTGCGTVQLLGQSVTELVSQLDKDKEYKGIYSI
ncbi:hypothetical protein JavanS441_0005 [Streptococcus satellite phage Javan441]|uniref:Uncharacterized protein n=2 Tax=Streptococcus pseudoporcinus TaxID=361101 RepID=G5K856_9STRE|nr:hypothetical protein HMPREF9320_0977 [Streptococcus pseudoporcinus SPIN 20026]EHI65762.1 hypothetical protein STRPS_1129 [Streptococcus pseudoporcinus LQ 940-04]QBX10465.1 hypothetical protein JavanS441_0005 [Streptococcus satellite phage Javan441]QBX10484.1 hypothetical protein JavanS442_0005 [Streptococcus satellite phage Javan442]